MNISHPTSPINMPYSIWLKFEKRTENKLRKTINDLATKKDAPSFIPHITLYGGVNFSKTINEKVICNLLNEISKASLPFTAKANQFKTSSFRFKSLYLSIDKDQKILDLFNSVKTRLSENEENLTDYNFDPHISIIYPKYALTETEKQTEIDNLKEFENKDLLISKISVVVPLGFNDDNQYDWNDVEKWHEIASFPLGYRNTNNANNEN